jgi:hypothetical protein
MPDWFLLTSFVAGDPILVELFGVVIVAKNTEAEYFSENIFMLPTVIYQAPMFVTLGFVAVALSSAVQ